MKRIFLLANSLGIATLVLTASPALASPPAPTSSASSIALTATTTPSGSIVAPSLGSSAWFAAQYPKTTKNPVIETNCYQNGVIVWGEVDTVSAAATSGVLLGGDSSPWIEAGGSANCVATLESRIFKPSGEVVTNFAQTSFSAS